MGEWLSHTGITYYGTTLLLTATQLSLRFFLSASYLVCITLFLTAVRRVFSRHSLLLLPVGERGRS